MDEKQYTMEEELFEKVVLQVGILKETYDKIGEQKGLNFFQKQIMTKNKKQNTEVLLELEEIFNKSQ